MRLLAFMGSHACAIFNTISNELEKEIDNIRLLISEWHSAQFKQFSVSFICHQGCRGPDYCNVLYVSVSGGPLQILKLSQEPQLQHMLLILKSH